MLEISLIQIEKGRRETECNMDAQPERDNNTDSTIILNFRSKSRDSEQNKAELNELCTSHIWSEAKYYRN